MSARPFCAGLAMGAAAGICLGMQMKARERAIRRGIHRTARRMEDAFDTMIRCRFCASEKKFDFFQNYA